MMSRTGDNAFEGGHESGTLVGSVSFPTFANVLCRMQAAIFEEWIVSYNDAEVARARVTSSVATT